MMNIKNKLFTLLILLLAIGFVFILIIFNKTNINEIKDLETSLLTPTEKIVTESIEEYMFEDTLSEADIADLPKGYIYIIFNYYTCTKEEGLEFINTLDKKMYLGVIGDIHYIQMNTIDYEELYQICYNLMEDNLISIAYVCQQMFDDTLDSEKVELLKGKNVIYFQYIPSGKTADVNDFINYVSSYENGNYMGAFKNSIFVEYSNVNKQQLDEICHNISYPDDGYIYAYLLE